MTAWQVVSPGPVDTRPLHRATVPRPEPGDGELLVAVRACGVCRTTCMLPKVIWRYTGPM